MKIAASVLDCKDRISGVLKLNETNVNYIHVDVMDGKFVPNIEFDDINEIKEISEVSKYPLDVHLMVDDPSEYINKLDDVNIDFVTIHMEIDKDKKEIFKKIRDLGYKVGLSIKPNTNVSEIKPYLEDIDLVLVMSVEPGLGGQRFIDSAVDRIMELRELIKLSGRNIVIEVDGGINDETITKLKMVDIVVVGSYIVRSDDYSKSVLELIQAVNSFDSNKFKSKYLLYLIVLFLVILLLFKLL